MYKIVIKLEFDAVIGILPHERKQAQKVLVKAKIEYKNKKNFVDYAKVCETIQNIIQKEKFRLVEDALETVEKRLKQQFPQIKKIKLQIKKPEILKNALVGVEILRKY